ncbi:site-specific DNA-methyltransferase [Paenibacillus campinasensis]|uniref:Site-specific DNA-methyltransferase n=1 Tax=Paenibacillus campinasensis TaxID=66347 RepID=A0ABW9T608_9BACL|nr:site-specific DNA-methyltransferase [Paenibacillus campinasensis]MUG68534.1 site-specific DNA-methyltransferase [Paenibacillus campinasensis]
MNKLTMKSVDLTQVNIDKIAELFPNVITEARDKQGKIKRAIDFDLLRQELSDYIVEGEKERYQLTWPGKKEAILKANSSIDKTLRPVKEDSVDWDTTQNLYIEGDNLEVLKLLQESYLNKIKCIYIDPPYNTGKDFIYKDDFKEPMDEYLEESGQLDEVGNRLFQNTESNGRFHSDWLSMIYTRLKIARNLLKDDGVIFISVDENEVSNLKKVCDEIFGQSNFITTFMWKRKREISSDSKNVAIQGEYVLSYSKTDEFEFQAEPLSQDYINNSYNEPTKEYPDGKWRPVPITVSKGLSGGGYHYKIVTPGGKIHDRLWAYPESGYKRLLKEGRVYFGKDLNGVPQRVIYAHESKGQPTTNYWDNTSSNKEGKKEILNLFGDSFFDTPKPTALIERLLKLATKNGDLVLDFFSGSATTAHAVMQLNAEEKGNRRFLMVQLPEDINDTSEAYKAGYKNICEIGKERIRRAAKKIKEETGADIDYGFRVYRVDSSNMKDVYYTPDKLGQMNLDEMASNIKEDRTGEDLLIQVMLECGLELSLPMESKEIEGKIVHYVAGNSLIACFDDEVSETVIKKIAEDQPLRVVFRDSSFRDDSARINVEELFKLLSPSTEIQVL